MVLKSELFELIGSLRNNNVEVIITNNAEKEIEKFKMDGFKITRALSADKRTGIIFMGGFENKKISALAEHHVIILSERDVKEDVISAYEHAISNSECVFASSGPSKTADIEGKTVFGMHGPRKVTLVLEVKNEDL
ncbi:MAG: LUD domain-containing protein [Archaeoglobaceae archaeon]|nr:LUD domain-containing protein [Archaeoglobaceae archaeon]MDW8127780.1 LUD domain-containing protein [Archaeoglobaceae archaeon]